MLLLPFKKNLNRTLFFSNSTYETIMRMIDTAAFRGIGETCKTSKLLHIRSYKDDLRSLQYSSVFHWQSSDPGYYRYEYIPGHGSQRTSYHPYQGLSSGPVNPLEKLICLVDIVEMNIEFEMIAVSAVANHV